jgi:hypothetical protein
MNTIPSAKECAIYGVTEEIKWFSILLGIGFHPDTDFTITNNPYPIYLPVSSSG